MYRILKLNSSNITYMCINDARYFNWNSFWRNVIGRCCNFMTSILQFSVTFSKGGWRMSTGTNNFHSTVVRPPSVMPRYKPPPKRPLLIFTCKLMATLLKKDRYANSLSSQFFLRNINERFITLHVIIYQHCRVLPCHFWTRLYDFRISRPNRHWRLTWYGVLYL